MKRSDERISDRTDCAALSFAIVFPTVVTYAYFVLLAGQTAVIQQGAYLIGKTIQFAFPAIWIWVVLKKKPAWSKPGNTGLATGFALGLLILAAMLMLYFYWLKPSGFFDVPAEKIREKIANIGFTSATSFALLGLFYALMHSLMEEYYWRWFVFKRLQRRVAFGGAVVISSLGFMAHHVILLSVYFGWESPATYLFSFAVAIGGGLWAWLYARTGSLYGPWLSHCLVDAAIFILGYDLASDMFH